VAAKLVLVGRHTLPPRQEWSAWRAQQPADARLLRRLEQFEALEALRAEVELIEADVAEPGVLAAVVERTLARFGRLDGVIHAAGVAAHGLAQQKGWEAMAEVLRPKVEGTLALLE